MYQKSLSCFLFSKDKTGRTVDKSREEKQKKLVDTGRWRLCAFENSESGHINSKADLLETPIKDIFLEDGAEKLLSAYNSSL